MARPERPLDPWDAALSAIRSHVDDLGVWLAIWAARTEPDAHARRCANDAMDAVDAMLAGLHGIRARLIGQIRQADDDTAARADALLARMREGPPGRERESGPAIAPGRPHHASSPPPPQRQGPAVSLQRGAASGGEPR
jgi:hypothetical protein